MNAPEITSTRLIYVLGFNRCGTRSLTTSFKQAGIHYLHWDWNQLMLGDLHHHCRIALISHYVNSNAFLDRLDVAEHGETGDQILSKGTLLQRQLIMSDPDAYFILKSRLIEGWLQSRCRYLIGSFLEIYGQHVSRLGSYQLSLDDVQLKWRRLWCHVHAKILERSQKQPQLHSLVRQDLPRSGKG